MGRPFHGSVCRASCQGMGEIFGVKIAQLPTNGSEWAIPFMIMPSVLPMETAFFFVSFAVVVRNVVPS